jgi:hypothetical protein
VDKGDDLEGSSKVSGCGKEATKKKKKTTMPAGVRSFGRRKGGAVF